MSRCIAVMLVVKCPDASKTDWGTVCNEHAASAALANQLPRNVGCVSGLGVLNFDPRQALAHSWPRDLRKYVFPLSEPQCTHTLCKSRENAEQVLMVASHWPNQTWFSELTMMVSTPAW